MQPNLIECPLFCCKSIETDVDFDVSISNNSIDLEATAHCWHITADQNSNPVNIWIPAPPEELRAAYSLHVRNNLFVSVDEGSPFDISIHPTPTNQFLDIDYSIGNLITKVEVVNLMGQILTAFSISNTGTHRLNCSEWDSGLYLLKFSNDDTKTVKRFVVTK